MKKKVWKNIYIFFLHEEKNWERIWEYQWEGIKLLCGENDLCFCSTHGRRMWEQVGEKWRNKGGETQGMPHIQEISFDVHMQTEPLVPTTRDLYVERVFEVVGLGWHWNWKCVWENYSRVHQTNPCNAIFPRILFYPLFDCYLQSNIATFYLFFNLIFSIFSLLFYTIFT